MPWSTHTEDLNGKCKSLDKPIFSLYCCNWGADGDCNFLETYFILCFFLGADG